MIFTLDEPLRIAQHVDPLQQPGSYRTLIGGLHTSPALIAQDGAQPGIQVQLSPLAAPALLGVPAGEIAAIDLDGIELLGPAADELQQRPGKSAGVPGTWPVGCGWRRGSRPSTPPG